MNKISIIISKIPVLFPLKFRRMLFQNDFFRPIRRKISQLIFSNEIALVNLESPLENHQMHINFKMQKAYLYGTYEPELCEIFDEKIKQDFVCLDVGANIGYTSLLMAKLAGDGGKIIAFEPLPENYNVLKKNVALNTYQNIICENLALSNNISTEKFIYRSENLTAGGSIVSEKPIGLANTYQEISVQTITLDRYVEKNNIDRIDFIKIDVEGAEGLVIEGMKKLLIEQNPIVLLEPHFVEGSTLNQALEILNELHCPITELSNGHLLING